MKIKRDQLGGAILVALGIAVFLMTLQFNMPITAQYPGPRMLPSIAAFGFVVCGLGIFVQSTMSKKEEKTFLVKEGWIRMLLVILVLAGYIALMTVFGYFIATPIALYALTSMFGKGYNVKLKSKIIFSISVTVILYAMYVLAFGLTLPSGMFF